MLAICDLPSLRQRLRNWSMAGERVGFVPTMGNLHQGHMALVARARAECDKVVASIFVNPSQFGANEDLANYPRTPEKDQTLLAPVTDLLFSPVSEDIYPGGTCLTSIDLPPYTSELCGKFRPGHFAGVLTVVNLLFNLVQPTHAYFGLKDYQQYWLVCRMVADLHIPTEIVGVDTGRDADGLALSSRNQYLGSHERTTAPLLYQQLQQAATLLARLPLIELTNKHKNICDQAANELNQAGFRVDYFSLRDAHTLKAPTVATSNYRLLAAAWLGRARLIDNIAFNHKEDQT